MAKKKRGAPTKKCPKCGKIQHARVASCRNPKCSHVFVAKKKTVKVKKKAVKKKAMIRRAVTKKKSKRRGRPPGMAAGGAYSLADIQAAKALAGRLGGAAQAKRLLDALG